MAAMNAHRQHWMIAALIFVVAFAMRAPFRSEYAYHWDSAQYALAIEHFDMRIGQPHRPGYFLYVMAGKLVNVFVGDPHASLVWLSVLAGAALPALGFLLGRAMFDFRAGLVTAVILATSPLCWFSSAVALNNILDAALVVATMLLAWIAMRRGGTWPDVFGLALLLAFVAGVRQQTAPVLAPAWLYAFWKFRPPRGRKLAAGVAVCGGLCLSWFVPMVNLSGGFAVYRELLGKRVVVDAPLTPWGGGVNVLWENIGMIVASCWAGLLAAGVLGLAEFVTRAGKRDWLRQHREPLTLLGVWIVPMMAFGVAVYTIRPDYVLSYFPALAVLAGAVISRWWLVVPLIAILNCAVFLGRLDVVLGLPVTVATIREHDRQMRACFDAIRERFRPDEVLICHANQYFEWGFRQFQLHLPGYENRLLKPDPALAAPYEAKLWRAVGNATQFVDRFDDDAGKTRLLIVPPRLDKTIFETLLPVAEAQEWQIPGCPPQFILPAPAPP